MLFLMSVEGRLITLPSERQYKLGVQTQPTGDCIDSLFGMELANCQFFQDLQKLQTLLPPPLHTVAVGGGLSWLRAYVAHSFGGPCFQTGNSCLWVWVLTQLGALEYRVCGVSLGCFAVRLLWLHLGCTVCCGIYFLFVYLHLCVPVGVYMPGICR